MKRVIWSATLKWIRWVLFWITRWVMGLCQRQQDNLQGVQGLDLSGIQQRLVGSWVALLLSWCAYDALIPPPATLSMFQPKWRQENPISTELQLPSCVPTKGFYGATPPECWWCFSCRVALPALEGTEQLESPDGMGDLRRNHSPGHAWKLWWWEGGEAAGSWQLLFLPKAEGCMCAAFPGAATIPHFLEFLPPLLIFLLETRSVLLPIINYQNNKQIISSEQKFLLPAAFSWEGQWRMNQEREWPFLNVTCQHSERLVVTVPCRARAVVWQHWLLPEFSA